MQFHERPVVTALLTALTAAGKVVTINDGEDDVVTSDKLSVLRPELGGTGEDLLIFDGGFFHLIYNNGSINDPMIVISDYSFNDFCEDIWQRLDGLCAIREWVSLSERALRSIEILASEADPPTTPEKLMDRIEIGTFNAH